MQNYICYYLLIYLSICLPTYLPTYLPTNQNYCSQQMIKHAKLLDSKTLHHKSSDFQYEFQEITVYNLSGIKVLIL